MMKIILIYDIRRNEKYYFFKRKYISIIKKYDQIEYHSYLNNGKYWAIDNN